MKKQPEGTKEKGQNLVRIITQKTEMNNITTIVVNDLIRICECATIKADFRVEISVFMLFLLVFLKNHRQYFRAIERQLTFIDA